MEIARHGYMGVKGVPPLSATAFFPLIPLIIHIFTPWGAWLLTQAIFAADLWLLQQLLRNWQWSVADGHWTLLFFALNPAAVYYSTLYAEPWTVFFTLLAITVARHRRWLSASVMGVCSALTQGMGGLTGTFPLATFVLAATRGDWRQWRGAFLWGIGTGLGLLFYIGYLGVNFHHPMLFSSIQSSPFWSAHWEWPWAQWWAGAKYITFHINSAEGLLVGINWWIINVYILAAVVLWVHWSRDPGRWEWMEFPMYATFGLLVSLSFSQSHHLFHSTARLVSIYFPLYIGMARFPIFFRKLLLIVFLALAVIGAVLFTHQWFFQ